MGNRATGSFTLDSWDETAYSEGTGAKLARIRNTKTFRGDIDGTSSGEVLTAVAGEHDSAVYVAIEPVSARVHGRSGTFVLHHRSTAAGSAYEQSVLVLPGSGTGDLHGITGEMTIQVASDGTYTFDYELPTTQPS